MTNSEKVRVDLVKFCKISDFDDLDSLIRPYFEFFLMKTLALLDYFLNVCMEAVCKVIAISKKCCQSSSRHSRKLALNWLVGWVLYTVDVLIG